MNVANWVSLTFLGAIAGPLTMYATTGETFYGALAAIVIAVAGFVEGMKRLLGTGAFWLQRPHGATSCDVFCVGQVVEGSPGFPSGHMAVVSVVVMALWLHLEKSWILYIGLPWICAMAWARWVKRCHTWVQIIGGVVVGVVAAYVLNTYC